MKFISFLKFYYFVKFYFYQGTADIFFLISKLAARVTLSEGCIGL